jgi:poly(A) polymerase
MPRSLRGLPALRRIPFLAGLLKRSSARGRRVYLTGGYLRDLLLGRRPKGELDLTVEDPTALLRGLRLKEGESSFLMDVERETWRLVLPPPSTVRFLDVTKFRAATIEEDLRLRDFTINALALDLTVSPAGAIIDVMGGRNDISARVLRACSTRSMKDDPLRALRGIRLAVNLDLSMEGGTRTLIAGARRSLSTVSAERIRDELFQILGGPEPARGMREILDLGLLSAWDPSFRTGKGASLIFLRRCLTLLEDFPPRGPLRQLLAGDLQEGISRRGLLLLAAFLTDRQGSSRAGAISRCLALGKKARRQLCRALEAELPRNWAGRPGELGRVEFLDLFHRCDGVLEEVLMLQALLLTPAAARGAAVRTFLRRYRGVRPSFLHPPILTGGALQEHLRLEPGRELGNLLRAAKRAQDLGSFRDLEGALLWARKERERVAETGETGHYRDG